MSGCEILTKNKGRITATLMISVFAPNFYTLILLFLCGFLLLCWSFLHFFPPISRLPHNILRLFLSNAVSIVAKVFPVKHKLMLT
ncbi:MAG: hypothetical protein DMG15_28255 [Acidobacteria bacterium]|nr:MAG: hypothetical protein DMG15_28255 [Acidobacteriota bacterium]